MRAIGVGLAAAALLTGCVSDGSQPGSETGDAADPAPGISVEVPPDRLTPFCQAMIELTDRVRSGEAVGDEAILETYRSISDDVPAAIADDFDRVLTALETGTPIPTDPPRDTIQTVPRPSPPASDEPTTTTSAPPPADTTVTSTDPSDGEDEASVPDSSVVDERFDRDGSPADRINSYVTFVCRSADNNPGPPATQPLDGPPDDDG